jgi:hypothetical protein
MTYNFFNYKIDSNGIFSYITLYITLYDLSIA